MQTAPSVSFYERLRVEPILRASSRFIENNLYDRFIEKPGSLLRYAIGGAQNGARTCAAWILRFEDTEQ